VYIFSSPSVYLFFQDKNRYTDCQDKTRYTDKNRYTDGDLPTRECKNPHLKTRGVYKCGNKKNLNGCVEEEKKHPKRTSMTSARIRETSSGASLPGEPAFVTTGHEPFERQQVTSPFVITGYEPFERAERSCFRGHAVRVRSRHYEARAFPPSKVVPQLIDFGGYRTPRTSTEEESNRSRHCEARHPPNIRAGT